MLSALPYARVLLTKVSIVSLSRLHVAESRQTSLLYQKLLQEPGWWFRGFSFSLFISTSSLKRLNIPGSVQLPKKKKAKYVSLLNKLRYSYVIVRKENGVPWRSVRHPKLASTSAWAGRCLSLLKSLRSPCMRWTRCECPNSGYQISCPFAVDKWSIAWLCISKLREFFLMSSSRSKTYYLNFSGII